MGQPVTVIQKASARPDVVRFEINRSITGMGIERYPSADSVIDGRPSDEVARRLFAQGGVRSVTVSANQITVDLEPGADTAGMREILEELFLYYREGVEVEMPEGAAAD